MKPCRNHRSVWLIVVITFLPVHISAAEKLVDWQQFSRNLIKALASPNEGVQLSAMQQIIKYSEHLHVTAAVIDIMRIYRNHAKFQVRRLALTALAKTKSNYAMGFLRRHSFWMKGYMCIKVGCMPAGNMYPTNLMGRGPTICLYRS